jgi:hypothetical protein
VLAVDIGDQRLSDIWNLDMRLAWNKNLGRARLNLSADVFNVLNSGTVLRRVDSADSSAFNRIDQNLNPLLVRFGARLSF